MGIFNEAIPNPGASHGNYAKNLFHLGFGLPLWHPRPLKTGDILIGDVGFMRHGIIYKLFNATTPADNDLASREVDLVDRGAPTPLGVAIDNSKLCVGTVLPAVLCDLDTFPAAGADAKGGVFLATKGPSGSALVIPDGARRVHLNPESIHDVITLIRQHHRAWHARASNFDCITSASHTLVLVTGYVHSARWSAATFDHANTPSRISYSPANDMLSPRFIIDTTDAHLHYHSNMSPGTAGDLLPSERWPPPAWASSEETLRSPDVEHVLFLHVFGIRFRSGMYDADDRIQDSDYIDILLTYILKNSSAHVAAVHDKDVYTLCKNKLFPSRREFAKQLEDEAPKINVDETGLGMLAPRKEHSLRAALLSRMRASRARFRRDLDHSLRQVRSPTSLATTYNALETFYRGLR